MISAALSRHLRRLWISGTASVVLISFTAQSAHACIAHCVAHYGSIFQPSPGVFWELSYCTQTETMTGPVTITCYYTVKNYSML